MRRDAGRAHRHRGPGEAKSRAAIVAKRREPAGIQAGEGRAGAWYSIFLFLSGNTDARRFAVSREKD